MSRWKQWAGIGAVGAVMLVTGLGVGASALAAPSPAPKTAPALPEDPTEIGPLFGVVHGDLHLLKYDGSTVDATYDRGMITSRTPTSITFARLDGAEVTVSVDSGTIVREGLRRVSPARLRVGDRAMFLSYHEDDGSLEAVLIRSISHRGLGS